MDGKQSNIIDSKVRSFSLFLESNRIEHALLEENTGILSEATKDIDIFVNFTSKTHLKYILESFCTRAELTLVQILNHHVDAYYCILAIKTPIDIIYLKLDIYKSIILKNRKIFSSRFFVENTDNKAKPKRLNSSAFALYYLVKKAYKFNKSSREDITKLRRVLSDVNQQAIEELTKKQSLDLNIRKIQQSLTGCTNKTQFARLMNSCYNDILKRSRSAVIAAKNLQRIVARILFPTGLIIGILGQDGSGKSTFINQINLPPTFRQEHILHFYSPQHSSQTTSTIPTRTDSRGTITSLAKLIYLFIKIYYTYLTTIYPAKIKSGLIFIDRPFIDITVDPERYRHRGKSSSRFFSRLLPKPDLYIFMLTEPNTCFSRKQENTLTKAFHLHNQYTNLANTIPNAFTINTETTASNANAVINQLIVQTLSKRLRQ